MIKIGTVNGDVIEAGGVKNVTNHYYGEREEQPTKDLTLDAETGLPEELRSEEAEEIWEVAKEEGWVDENLQPKGLSRPDAALLAARMAKLLGIEGWVPFEQLWHRKNMRQDYAKTQYRKNDDFEMTLKRKLH